MAGLLAAAVLAEAYDQVTVVERDQLSPEPNPRRGVPQGKHVHVLLSRGAKAIEDTLPGFLAELIRDGGVTVDNLSQFHFDVDGHVLCQDDSTSDRTHLQSRPFLESRVLARVRKLPNVRVLDGHDVVDLRWDVAGSRVVGAIAAPRAARDERRELSADLVVAALGRNGRVGAWLTQHGYDEPREQELRIDLQYVSRMVRMDPNLTAGLRAAIVSATAARPTGVTALLQENDIWVLSVEGFAGHHPPTDPDAWLELAAELVPPQLAIAVKEAEMVTDISAHRFPANLWRRYDKLGRFPDGLIVTGDAVCSFNPTYGQGMTVAALEAQVLRDLLRTRTRDLAGRFFKRAYKPVKVAWEAAIGADLSMPPDVVPGPRPIPVRAVNAYLDRYLEAAERDPELVWNFLKVTGFDKPARALFTPHAIRCIARSRRPRTQERVSTGQR